MKLTDTQRVLLSKAAQHPAGLMAPPAMPPAPRQSILIKFTSNDLIRLQDLPAGADPAMAWGRDTEGKAVGYAITAAGLRAIGVEPEGEGPDFEIEGAVDPLTGAVGAAPLAAAKPTRAARKQEKAQEAAPAEAPADGAPRKRKAQAEAEAAADRGELPEPPDFTANTHAPYRKKLDKLVDMAKAGDAAGLRGFEIKPTSTSPRALIRYRDLAVRAIEAKAG